MEEARLPTKKVIKEFIQCIQRHETQKSAGLLAANPDLVDATVTSPPKKYDGQSLLQIAFRNGASQIAINLIEAGADVNFMEESEINRWNTPVLHDAINASVWATMEQTDEFCQEVIAALRLLLGKGADPNSVDSFGTSAFSRLLNEAERRLGDVYVEGIYRRHTDKARYIRQAHDMLVEFGAIAEYNRPDGSDYLSEKQLKILGL